ncbi:unnamed protein product [Durusdinium trenchii]|uniref:Uncharacterized protein n=1 Tax=Durusdinium trenchii TaxID=1381693 RepID=A0ABP0I581_9DINO
MYTRRPRPRGGKSAKRQKRRNQFAQGFSNQLENILSTADATQTSSDLGAAPQIHSSSSSSGVVAVPKPSASAKYQPAKPSQKVGPSSSVRLVDFPDSAFVEEISSEEEVSVSKEVIEAGGTESDYTSVRRLSEVSRGVDQTVFDLPRWISGSVIVNKVAFRDEQGEFYLDSASDLFESLKGCAASGEYIEALIQSELAAVIPVIFVIYNRDQKASLAKELSAVAAIDDQREFVRQYRDSGIFAIEVRNSWEDCKRQRAAVHSAPCPQAEDAELPKPFLVKPSNLKDLKVSCPEASRFYASEVRENVPLFKERVSILHMPGEVDEKNDLGDSSKALDEESDGYEPSLAPEGAAAPPDEEAVEHSSNHSILHLPKRADCPICQEAKQDAVPARNQSCKQRRRSLPLQCAAGFAYYHLNHFTGGLDFEREASDVVVFLEDAKVLAHLRRFRSRVFLIKGTATLTPLAKSRVFEKWTWVKQGGSRKAMSLDTDDKIPPLKDDPPQGKAFQHYDCRRACAAHAKRVVVVHSVCPLPELPTKMKG